MAARTLRKDATRLDEHWPRAAKDREKDNKQPLRQWLLGPLLCLRTGSAVL